MNVARFLNDHQVEFELLPHSRTFEAQRMAHELHVPGREVAKTVLLKDEDSPDFVVAVLPAHKLVNLERVSQLMDGHHFELASENEIAEHCPDCEVGALPPFGSQYSMKTIVDNDLVADEEIVFEGNTHNEAVRMKFNDFRILEQPLVASFAQE